MQNKNFDRNISKIVQPHPTQWYDLPLPACPATSHSMCVSMCGVGPFFAPVCQERVFGILDYDITAHANLSLETASGMTCYRMNRTREWLQSLPEDLRKIIMNLCRRMYDKTIRERRENFQVAHTLTHTTHTHAHICINTHTKGCRRTQACAP